MTELGFSIAQKLKAARAARGFEQKYVAAQIGISESKLGHYENGRAEPDIDTLHRLSKFYDASLDEWLNLNDPNEPLMVTQTDEKDVLMKYRRVSYQMKEDIRDYVNMKYSKYIRQEQNPIE
jgi:transcriptional regulator with XRE-family HTH domain